MIVYANQAATLLYTSSIAPTHTRESCVLMCIAGVEPPNIEWSGINESEYLWASQINFKFNCYLITRQLYRTEKVVR